MVIADPPSVPAVNATVNEPSPAVTEPIVDAAGAVEERPDVMTRLPLPLMETATNFCCPVAPPHVTESQPLSAADVRLVQVMPSGLVMTRLYVPVEATATNFCCPAGPPHVTERQALTAAGVRLAQVMPSAYAVDPKRASGDAANAATAMGMTLSSRRARVRTWSRSILRV